jgi:hypothetical protein
LIDIKDENCWTMHHIALDVAMLVFCVGGHTEELLTDRSSQEKVLGSFMFDNHKARNSHSFKCMSWPQKLNCSLAVKSKTLADEGAFSKLW